MSLLSGLRARVVASQNALIRCKDCDITLASLSLSAYLSASINPDKTHMIVYPVLKHLQNYPGHKVVSLFSGVEFNVGKKYYEEIEAAAATQNKNFNEVLENIIRKLEKKGVS